MAIKSKGKQFLSSDLDVSKYEHFDAVKNNPDIDLGDYREAYKHASGKPFPLGNDHIIAMIACADDDYDENVFAQAMQYMVEGKEPSEAMAEAIADAEDNEGTGEDHPEDAEVKQDSKPEKVTAPVETPAQAASKREKGIAIHNSALRIAEQLSQNNGLTTTIDNIITAGKTLRGAGPNMLMQLFVSTAKVLDNGHVIDCDIDGWPIVGSTMKDINPSETNKVFDKYEYKDTNTNVSVKGSFHKDMFNALPICSRIEDELELVKSAISKDAVTPPKYKGEEWSYDRLMQEEKTIKRSLAEAFAKYKEAINIRHRMLEIEEKCPHVEVSFVFQINPKTGFPQRREDGSLVLQKTDDVIVVKDKRGVVPGYRYLTVKELFRCNIELAAKNGGTRTALVDTLAKEPTTGKGAKNKPTINQLYPEIKSFDAFESCMSAFANFFETVQTKEQKAEMKTMFAKHLQGEGRKDFVNLMGAAWSGLITYFTPDLQKEYAENMEAEAKKETERRANAA